jgi:hypothetical protein
LRLREVTGEAAWCLRGGRGALGMRATDSMVKMDRATDLRDPELGCEVSGRRGLGAGQWASGVCTGSGAGPWNSEGARRKRSRGGRRKEEEGKAKMGAPTGAAEQSEEEGGRARVLLGRVQGGKGAGPAREGKRNGPRGRKPARGGRERWAGLKARFAFPYFFSFSFSNQLKSI